MEDSEECSNEQSTEEPKTRKRKPGGGRKKAPELLHGKKFIVSLPGVLARFVEVQAEAAGVTAPGWIRDRIKEILQKMTSK